MINKIAQPPYWPKVKQGIQTLGLNPEIMSMLNSNKCVWDSTPPASNPNAVAYVSSEDVNDDGKIDKIHFVINKFPPMATDDEIKGLVSQIAKTLVHEYGHIQDFDAEKGMFPGGEGAAEAAERAAEGMINQRLELFSKTNPTNKKIGIDNVIKRNSIGEYKMKKELIKLANHLDNIGHRDLADKLDNVIKQAQDVTGGGEGFTVSSPGDETMLARMEYGYPDDDDWNELSEAEQQEVVDHYLAVQSGNAPEGTVEVGEPVITNRGESGAQATERDEADDFAFASNSTQDRIDKLAELMSREFTTNVPGTFSR